MPSYGEGEVTVGTRIGGQFRVIGLSAAHAIHPRILLVVQCALRELEESEIHHAPALKDYSLIDLTAELRLDEHGPMATDLHWLDRDRRVRSYRFESADQITLAGDLDPWRLERLERGRGEGPPVFWLQAWPTLLAASGLLHATVRPIRLQVPREVWHEFLAKVGYGRYEVVEVPFPERLDTRFREAMSHLNEARRLLREGHYAQSVLTGRKVIDAIRGELTDDRLNSRLRELLASRVGGSRADAYVTIVNQLKQLAAPAAHAFGARDPYLREEAIFVLRTTTSLLSLLGNLLGDAGALAEKADQAAPAAGE